MRQSLLELTGLGGPSVFMTRFALPCGTNSLNTAVKLYDTLLWIHDRELKGKKFGQISMLRDNYWLTIYLFESE